MVILREGIVLEDMVIVEQCDGIVAVNNLDEGVCCGWAARVTRYLYLLTHA